MASEKTRGCRTLILVVGNKQVRFWEGREKKTLRGRERVNQIINYVAMAQPLEVWRVRSWRPRVEFSAHRPRLAPSSCPPSLCEQYAERCSCSLCSTTRDEKDIVIFFHLPDSLRLPPSGFDFPWYSDPSPG